MTQSRVRMIDPAEARADATLGGRLAAGDERAFDEVVRCYGGGVRRLAQRLLGWRREDADDVAQEVFVQVYRKRAAYRGAASLKTWLTRITVNECRRLQRRKWLAPGALWQALQARRQAESAGDAETAGAVETAGVVRAAVRRLPTREREVVVLYYLEQMSAGEVAAVLQLSVAAVNVRLHRARGRLEGLLAKYGGSDHD